MLNKKGITLVELMAAIAIVGILSGIAIMSVTKYQEKTRKDVYKNHETNLKDGVINYFTSN
ncbi:MAG: prepilin-type N-terminal cleavage/methylation domain-containing protein, partial [Bacilli bacterium]|nr:prepilin-type N-terminal cleavage/methylation domain-containing protein [Bacilli bacterium]